jgi:arabinoxylan arabinofuranohydrolase
MKKRIPMFLLSTAAVFSFLTAGYADNPIVQTIYTSDPAPMVYNDTLYLFTGHDADLTESNFYTMKDWRCYSTTDMVNWRDCGVMVSLKSFSWAPSNGAWAAQTIYRNGKFYYYCAIQGYGIAVPVSKNPYGPFTDTLGHAILNHSWNDIDPTVFIDDDGQAYMYWGNPQCYWVKLNQDMLSYSGKIDSLVTKPSTYQEGPWFYKRNSIYYLVYSTTPNSTEAIAYATSTSATGTWTYKGVIMSKGTCYTNHSGITDYKGKSYFFYHNAALTGGGTYKRSVCVEEFTYNSDGTIPTINATTSGPAQIANLDPYDTTQAETICWESGVETGTCSEGGIEVDSIHNGDYIKVKGVNFGSGAKSFSARVSSATSGGKIELHLDSLKGTTAGTCTIAGTGSWSTWATDTCSVSGASGIHDLYLKFTGSGSGLLFNFNWWKFNATTGTIPTLETTGGYGSGINIEVHADHVILNFPKTVFQGMASVRLFDMTGRLVATLFAGRLRSPLLSLPLDPEHIRQGAYIIRATLDNSVTSGKNIVVFNKR